MKRSCALALSAATLFLATSAASYAQAIRPGQQCQPAVANPSMYGNCRLHVVRGQEVCRCAVRPQALRRIGPEDRSNLNTGSLASPGASAVGGFFEGGTRSTGRAGASVSGAGAGAPTAGSATADVASGASGGMNGNGQGPGNNNGLGNGSEPADNTSTDVKGTDPSNPGGGNGNGGGRGGNGSGAGNGRR